MIGKDAMVGMLRDGYSIRRMASCTGLSATTVRYWLRKHNLPCARKSPARLLKHKCRVCGTLDPTKLRVGRYTCKTCHNQDTIRRGQAMKLRAVKEKGGRCEICGYSKNIACLDFHRGSPGTKDPNWRTSRYWHWDRMKRELSKCRLLCRNCHGELHNPQTQTLEPA